MKRLRKRLTYANVMSSIAVFLVLGGAAVAATQLPKNSVGSKQLKKNAVTTKKIKNNAVTGSKLKNGSVTNEKLAEGAVTGNKVAAGTIGRGNIAESQFIPRGYAFVELSGKVNPSFSSGIPNGTHPSIGVYCFDLAFTPVSAQVTTEADSEPNDIDSVIVKGAGEELITCPTTDDLEVRGWDTQFDELSSEQFFLVVW